MWNGKRIASRIKMNRIASIIPTPLAITTHPPWSSGVILFAGGEYPGGNDIKGFALGVPCSLYCENRRTEDEYPRGALTFDFVDTVIKLARKEC